MRYYQVQCHAHFYICALPETSQCPGGIPCWKIRPTQDIVLFPAMAIH